MTNKSPLVSGTHHVAVISSDCERSKHFYVGVLGEACGLRHLAFAAARANPRHGRR